MTTNQFFLQATDHFYKNQYQHGLLKINQCIQLHQHNSTLLSNRALFYSQMGHLEKAIQQLQNCIRLDHQNYIPYFNLFSLKVRINQLEDALKDLACSLSCLYLTRARFRKREQDAKQAIKHAKNNVEAHVLRAMMLLENKKLKDCMNELDWAYEYDQNIPTLNKIRSIVQKKLGVTQNSSQNSARPVSSGVQRLTCSYEAVQSDLLMEIRMKMEEFNSVYNDLNEENGIVTHRVPRTLLPQEIQKLLIDNDLKENIQELYELKYNPDNTQEPVIYQMKEEYRVQNQLEFEDRLKEDEASEKSIRSENQPEDLEELNNSSFMDLADEKDQIQISKLAADSKNHLMSEVNQGENPDEQSISQGEFNEYLVVDEYPEFPPIPEEHSQSKLSPSESAITDSKIEYFESSVSSRDIQEPTALYPIKRRLYGRFKIERFEVDSPQTISDFFSRQANNVQLVNQSEMYCVCTYFKQKPGYKVTTCDRGIFFNADSRMLECEWNETFKEIALTPQPQQVSIKIYKKNTQSYNDDLVGIGTKLIESSGEIILPIVNAGDPDKQLGYLYLRLFLVDK